MPSMNNFIDLVHQGSLHAWFYIPTAILLGAMHGLAIIMANMPKSRLRNKINLPNLLPLLHTLRGVFVAEKLFSEFIFFWQLGCYGWLVEFISCSKDIVFETSANLETTMYLWHQSTREPLRDTNAASTGEVWAFFG